MAGGFLEEQPVTCIHFDYPKIAPTKAFYNKFFSIRPVFPAVRHINLRYQKWRSKSFNLLCSLFCSNSALKHVFVVDCNWN